MNNEVDWLFLDLNAFFASCEQQENPKLRGKPVGIIPLQAETTCVLAASYEAKRYGIKTGTTVSDARQRCPDIQFVLSRPKKYVEYHHKILAAIDTCIPVEYVCSIDEVACRLMTEQRQLHHAKALAMKTKKAITSMVGECLTSSVGLASNMLLAKVAADMQKPDGLTVILPEHLPNALYGLKLSDIPGIGRNMLKRLYRHSVYDMESLLALDSMRMRGIWGGVQGARFHAMLHGKEVPKLQTHTSVIGHQHVLEPRLRSRTGAFVTLQKLLTKAAERMRSGGHYCRAMTVQVKLTQRLGYFEGKRHFHETQDTAFLLHQLQRIWRDFPRDEPLRVGVTLHDLIPATAHQLEMFDAPKKAGALRAIDAINKRYGRGTISFGIKPEPKESVGFDKIAFSRVPTLYEAG